MSYNSELQANNAELEEILASVNALPNANSESDGVVVARFSGQDWSTIFCDSHTHNELFSHLDQGRRPVIAHITIEIQDDPIPTYITANCWAEHGIVYVGEHFGSCGWVWVEDSERMWTEF